MLSDELNASGQTMGDGILIRLPLYYSADALHERVVKPYLNAIHPEKDSTTQLTTVEMQELYEQLNAIIAERSGVSVSWPDEYSMSLEGEC